MTQKTERRLPTHRPPTHPGEMLLEEFLKPATPPITPYAFAKAINVSLPRMYQVLAGERAMTPDTALRVARATNTSPEFWMGLQFDYDLWHALRAESPEVKKIQRLPAFAGK